MSGKQGIWQPMRWLVRRAGPRPWFICTSCSPCSKRGTVPQAAACLCMSLACQSASAWAKQAAAGPLLAWFLPQAAAQNVAWHGPLTPTSPQEAGSLSHVNESQVLLRVRSCKPLTQVNLKIRSSLVQSTLTSFRELRRTLTFPHQTKLLKLLDQRVSATT